MAWLLSRRKAAAPDAVVEAPLSERLELKLDGHLVNITEDDVELQAKDSFDYSDENSSYGVTLDRLNALNTVGVLSSVMLTDHQADFSLQSVCLLAFAAQGHRCFAQVWWSGRAGSCVAH